MHVKSVFLIDDDNVFNFLSKKIIQKSHFADQVNTYIGGEKALADLKEIAESNPEDLPELIFLDINMPLMDGWEFLDEFKKLPDYVFKHSKVLMLTSSIDPKDIEKSKTYSMVHDFISKPLTNDKIQMLSGIEIPT